jgi:hypothetical protein
MCVCPLCVPNMGHIMCAYYGTHYVCLIWDTLWVLTGPDVCVSLCVLVKYPYMSKCPYMCVLICVSLYVRPYMCVLICASLYVRPYMCVLICASLYVCPYMCVLITKPHNWKSLACSVPICPYMSLYVQVSLYVRPYMCLYVCPDMPFPYNSKSFASSVPTCPSVLICASLYVCPDMSFFFPLTIESPWPAARGRRRSVCK